MTADTRAELRERIQAFDDVVFAPWVKDALVALAEELPDEKLEELSRTIAELEQQLAELDGKQRLQMLQVFSRELKRQQNTRREQ